MIRIIQFLAGFQFTVGHFLGAGKLLVVEGFVVKGMVFESGPLAM
jgi:hypothetical protein